MRYRSEFPLIVIVGITMRNLECTHIQESILNGHYLLNLNCDTSISEKLHVNSAPDFHKLCTISILHTKKLKIPIFCTTI